MEIPVYWCRANNTINKETKAKRSKVFLERGDMTEMLGIKVRGIGILAHTYLQRGTGVKRNVYFIFGAWR